MQNRNLIITGFLILLVVFGLLQRPENILLLITGFILLAMAERVKIRQHGKHQRQTWLNLILVMGGTAAIFFSIISLNYISILIFSMLIIGFFYYSIINRDSEEETDSELGVRQTVIVDEDIDREGKRPFLQFDRLFMNDTYEDAIYAWEDVEMYHIYSNNFIDFGSTIVPLGTNVVVISQGAGKTKVVVPEGVGLSLHANAFRSDLLWDGKSIPLNNERQILETEGYDTAKRKIYLQMTQGWGTIEVVFL